MYKLKINTLKIIDLNIIVMVNFYKNLVFNLNVNFFFLLLNPFSF